MLDRFTHTFAIYEADALPAEYIGKMFAIAPHRHYVVCTDIAPQGSTFHTHDLEQVITPGKQPGDEWFTPVDIQVGLDGAMYIADWHAAQANHFRSAEGQTSPEFGRIYRLAGKETPPAKPFDLGALPSEQLIKQYMGNPNPWYRQQVLRLLGDRKDRTQIPLLGSMVRESTGQTALEALWGLNLCGGFDDAFAMEALHHADPHVAALGGSADRRRNKSTPEVAKHLATMAAKDINRTGQHGAAC